MRLESLTKLMRMGWGIFLGADKQAVLLQSDERTHEGSPFPRSFPFVRQRQFFFRG